MKPECHQFAVEIFKVCSLNRVSLNMEWIPRDKNKEADRLSRLSDFIDTDNWGLIAPFFSLIISKFGPFSVDCFANFYNKKVVKFYSLFHVPGSSGVDAFTFDWANKFCLLTPPVAVVGRSLEHLFCCRSKGVLIVPMWPSSFYWPLLLGFLGAKERLYKRLHRLVGRSVRPSVGPSVPTMQLCGKLVTSQLLREE
jgi:hypothetical protein